MVMPYSSATGSSGVAHMACEYGLPIVCADIADFREMGDDEQLAISFFKTGDAHSMADCIVSVLENPAAQREMGEANFSVALRQTMPMIINQYLRSFRMQHGHNALQPFSRFRRLPGWVPFVQRFFAPLRPGGHHGRRRAISNRGSSPTSHLHPVCTEFEHWCWWVAGRRWSVSASFPWRCSTCWDAVCSCARSIAFGLRTSGDRRPQ